MPKPGVLYLKLRSYAKIGNPSPKFGVPCQNSGSCAKIGGPMLNLGFLCPHWVSLPPPPKILAHPSPHLHSHPQVLDPHPQIWGSHSQILSPIPQIWGFRHLIPISRPQISHSSPKFGAPTPHFCPHLHPGGCVSLSSSHAGPPPGPVPAPAPVASVPPGSAPQSAAAAPTAASNRGSPRPQTRTPEAPGGQLLWGGGHSRRRCLDGKSSSPNPEGTG